MSISAGKVYMHYKGGTYLVLFVAHESTNAREGGEVVVYQSLEKGMVHARDAGEFTENVRLPDGTMRPRFVLFSEHEG